MTVPVFLKSNKVQKSNIPEDACTHTQVETHVSMRRPRPQGALELLSMASQSNAPTPVVYPAPSTVAPITTKACRSLGTTPSSIASLKASAIWTQ